MRRQRHHPPRTRLGRRHWLPLSAALLAGGLSTAALSPAQVPARTPFAAERPAHFGEARSRGPEESAGTRFREGTKMIERIGYFRVQGDQVTFYAGEEEHRFVGLPNLNLERIARAITDDPGELEWSVTGVVTEYRGGNFLLVERAILRNKVHRAGRRE